MAKNPNNQLNAALNNNKKGHALRNAAIAGGAVLGAGGAAAAAVLATDHVDAEENMPIVEEDVNVIYDNEDDDIQEAYDEYDDGISVQSYGQSARAASQPDEEMPFEGDVNEIAVNIDPEFGADEEFDDIFPITDSEAEGLEESDDIEFIGFDDDLDLIDVVNTDNIFPEGDFDGNDIDITFEEDNFDGFDYQDSNLDYQDNGFDYQDSIDPLFQ